LVLEVGARPLGVQATRSMQLSRVLSVRCS
jgi:hypothetical protein